MFFKRGFVHFMLPGMATISKEMVPRGSVDHKLCCQKCRKCKFGFLLVIEKTRCVTNINCIMNLQNNII